MISVDSTVLNYSTYYPGKMLGSTLSVSNMSDCEQIVELSVDANNEHYMKSQIKERFPEASLPYTLETTFDRAGRKVDTIVNSEHKNQAWYVENPVSKELTKRITLKLGPKAEQDFIIVVRAPSAQKTENMLSILNIGLLTYADERFGINGTFEEFLKSKFAGNMKDFLRDRRRVAQA